MKTTPEDQQPHATLKRAELERILIEAANLLRAQKHSDAVHLLEPFEEQGKQLADYCLLRAKSHRALGELRFAAQWFDNALAIDPSEAQALHGRARVALQRSETEALDLFDKALRFDPGNADLWLGKAQALEVAGDINGAKIVAKQLCDQAPGLIPALSFLSSLKLAIGEPDYTAPFTAAEAKAPQDPNIPVAHIEALSGLDRAQEAAQIAQTARTRFPNEPHFALLEAVHAGSAGEWDRAEKIFNSLSSQNPLRWFYEARHRIRAGDTQQALTLLDQTIAADPWDIAAWALRGIGWRMSGDPRADWLHGQKGLVALRPLLGRTGLIEDVKGELRLLHSRSSMPLGQSLRGGTQTRGVLFERREPLFAELSDAIVATLEDHRRALPPKDDDHPLLRFRDIAWQLAGSWSVRLTGGGDYHTAHIHPQGLLSSALYLIVPEESHNSGRKSWLEIGRPPADLGLDLEPIHEIEPIEGHLALFPSTLYHGTTPFGKDERMTVAFDVASRRV